MISCSTSSNNCLIQLQVHGLLLIYNFIYFFFYLLDLNKFSYSGNISLLNTSISDFFYGINISFNFFPLPPPRFWKKVTKAHFKTIIEEKCLKVYLLLPIVYWRLLKFPLYLSISYWPSLLAWLNLWLIFNNKILGS